MAAQRDIRVELGERSYDIHIAPGSLSDAGALIAPHLPGGPVLVIADTTVAKLYGTQLENSLRAAGVTVSLSTFPAGERHKSIASAEALWAACAAAGVDRSGAIIALGGGVTGDLAGFVAASWMRGVSFIQIPTTLLAMVDSSVGGKTGVNSAAGKNLIGAFKQPAFVLIDPDVVHSMDAREYRAGIAEVVKYGVIKDPELFTWLEANHVALLAREAEAVTHAVATSCAIKAWYVANDEQEHGVRAQLNYGHTFGHALERETGYTSYLHGEAVAIGMQMAADFAQRIGLLTAVDLIERQTALLTRFDLPLVHRSTDLQGEAERMASACAKDKKVRQGQTRFILPKDYGVMELVAAPDPAAVRASFLAAMTDAVEA